MRITPRFILWAAAILLIVGFIAWAIPYYTFITQKLRISPFELLVGNTSSIKSIDGSVNILILGIGGGNHDGPNLSDSITVANYNLTTNRLTTVGVPRDVWSSTLRDKINSAYAYGEAKQVGGGIKLAEAEVSPIVGLPIQYAVVIDFDQFKQLIDYLGGIDVTVERSFTDDQYPIDGKENDLCGGDPDYKCRYETITFTKGLTHMDGTTALKYVRSRHATGAEGSDFARSERQQLVIDAVKTKVVALLKQGNVNTVSKLYDELNNLFKRDISNQQVALLAKHVIVTKGFLQRRFFLPQALFMVPPYDQYDGKYVLIPRTGNFDEIHDYVQCSLTKDPNQTCAVSVEK